MGTEVEVVPEKRMRRRGLRSLVAAAHEITESGMIEGLTKPGQLIALFLIYESKEWPIGRVLTDYSFATGEPIRAKKKREKQSQSTEEEPEPVKASQNETREAKAPTGPFVFENREIHQLPGDIPNAAGKDRRLWFEVVEKEAALLQNQVTAEVIHHKLNAIEATSVFRVISHMTTAVIEATQDQDGSRFEEIVNGEVKRRKHGECNGQLQILYRKADWRDWMRERLKQYLETKRREATEDIENQVYGDRPTEPEGESQEPTLKTEDESQLALASATPDRGDAYEGD